MSDSRIEHRHDLEECQWEAEQSTTAHCGRFVCVFPLILVDEITVDETFVDEILVIRA